MRVLEVRRHTMRAKPGQHLTQAGVTLARQVGETIGDFDLVVTSTLPRAYETAIAMGFAVDQQERLLAEMGEDIDAEVDWTAGFPSFAAAIERGGATARYVQRQAALWRAIVESIREGGRALIVSHGGIIEAGTIGCYLAAARWPGPALDYCEGVRLWLERGQWVDAAVVRAV